MAEATAADQRIVAVVVSFNPALPQLLLLLDLLKDQVAQTVVVDNGSDDDIDGWVKARQISTQFALPLGENLGIAAAQNRGIEVARSLGASAVILFDQDSAPSKDMVAKLAQTAAALKADGRDVAAVGPEPTDARLARKNSGATRSEPVRVDHVISSGSLIPIEAIDAVGPMREDLFIDYVDIEWCLRALGKGYYCFRRPDIAMAHEFGVPINALGRTFVSHSPLRHYYLFRNSVWLWTRSDVPLGWRLRNAPRLLMRLAFNLLFARPHRAQWSMMAQGVADGVAGRMGRREVASDT